MAKASLLFLVASTIGCDQATKHLAVIHLAGVPGQSFMGDTVRLEYAENTGGFLGLGADLPPWARTALFTVGNTLLMVVCAVVALRRGVPRNAIAGLSLILGGGISNLADRIARGSVVDFVNVGIGSLRTGIFNIADVAIMAGVVLLLIRTTRRIVGEPRFTAR